MVRITGDTRDSKKISTLELKNMLKKAMNLLRRKSFKKVTSSNFLIKEVIEKQIKEIRVELKKRRNWLCKE